MKKVCIFIILLLVPVMVFPEKWVGKAATYQLIDGTLTATGEQFDKDTLSAACNGFKLGTTVTLTNVNNGETVNVIINDRITENSNYFILLTPRAARELDIEWEAGVVIVDAQFSDVNSTERLDINGIVSEEKIDEETIKQFPEINWPDTTDITDSQETDTTDLFPNRSKEKDKPEKIKDKNRMDYDDRSTYYSFEKEDETTTINNVITDTEEDTGVPENDYIINPLLRKEKSRLMDEDYGVFRTFDEEIDDFPEDDYVSDPLKRENEHKMDQDTGIFTNQEEEISDEPAFAKFDTPVIRSTRNAMDYDEEDADNPLLDTLISPEKEDSTTHRMDEDPQEDPLFDKLFHPDRLIYRMDEDEQQEPRFSFFKYPEHRTRKFRMDKDETDWDYPLTETWENPDKILNSMDKDETDSNDPLLDEKENPEIKEWAMDHDEDDSTIPLKDYLLYPEKYTTEMDKDERDSNDPLLDEKENPENKEWAMDHDEDDSTIPLKDYLMYPEKYTTEMDSDETDKNYPDEEKVFYPDIFKNYTIDYDEDKEQNPDYVTDTNPDQKELNMDSDTEDTVDTEDTEDHGIWVTALPKGKIFVRFSTSFTRGEGDRRYLLFKELFPQVVGLKRNGKYILLLGPVDKNDVDFVLEIIRQYGFKDAYIMME